MWQDIKEIVLNNKGKVMGALIGLFISILYICLGFFKTTFIIICVALGVVIGKRLDDGNDFIETVKKLLASIDF